MIRILVTLFFAVFLLLPQMSAADPATITNEGASVFLQPDFDSDTIAQLPEGEKVEVSKRIFPGANKMGAFHRIKLPNGKMGFISDAEFKMGDSVKTQPAAAATKTEAPKENKKYTPFASSRYRGLSIDYVGYKEQTMGIQPTSNLVFYGFKMVGPDLMVEGDMVTEININVLPSAPPFYSEATSGANGWVLHSDFEFESIFTQTANVATYAGFGPMFKYDHYSISYTSAGKNNSYDVDDMILGAVFSAGFGLRMGRTCLRTEFKYNWEKTMYWGLGTSLLFQF